MPIAPCCPVWVKVGNSQAKWSAIGQLRSVELSWARRSNHCLSRIATDELLFIADYKNYKHIDLIVIQIQFHQRNKIQRRDRANDRLIRQQLSVFGVYTAAAYGGILAYKPRVSSSFRRYVAVTDLDGWVSSRLSERTKHGELYS